MTDARSRTADRLGLLWLMMAVGLGLMMEWLGSASKFDTLAALALWPASAILFALAATWLSALVESLSWHRWKRAMSLLAAIPFAFGCMPGLWSDFDLASRVRLARQHDELARDIAASPISSGRRQLRWDWGGTTTAVTGGALNTLVYDETDSLPLALSAGRPWPVEGKDWFTRDDPQVEALGGHFYLVTEFVA